MKPNNWLKTKFKSRGGKGLLMTLLVRDEEDIVRQNIDFHLSKGVDFIIATDNGSVDKTKGILEGYRRKGVLHLIDEKSRVFAQAEWVNRMGRLAYDEYKGKVKLFGPKMLNN